MNGEKLDDIRGLLFRRSISFASGQALHVPHNLRKSQRKLALRFTIDHAFEAVIDACASVVPNGISQHGRVDQDAETRRENTTHTQHGR